MLRRAVLTTGLNMFRVFYNISRSALLAGAFALPLAPRLPAQQKPPITTATLSVRADTIRLTLDSARVLALRANPELRAARLEIDVARGELRQASLFLRDNPELEYLGRGIGPELDVTQEVEVAGQRGARRSAAQAGIQRAAADVNNVARTTLGDVDRTFFRLFAADRRLELAREILALNERLAEVSSRQLQSGEISKLEFNLAVVELGRARARALTASRERAETANELRYLLGMAPRTLLSPVADSADQSRSAAPLDVDSLTALALARRPDLAERAAALRQTSAEVSLARREALPNLLLRATSEQLEGTDTREIRPGVGLRIPLFNRNQGEVQALRAAERQAELAMNAVALQVRAEVARAAASYETAASEQAILETTVLAPARENRRLLEIAFREGKVGIAELLLIRNQVIDAELEFWEAWLAEREARADLAEAIAETVSRQPQR